ncbi:MAG: Hsp20/alpha crystallin family protein [bacterium]|nr:Hsp20/alpha crystallin family protein [bacterium]
MAREKRSLFEWLTGGAGADGDYSFDDLDQGGGGYAPKPARGARSLPVEAVEEEPQDGELAVDVHQTPTHIVIKAMIAGVRPEDLDIAITRDMVTLRGKRERHTEGGAGDFFFQELYWGSFARTVVLPQEVDIEGAEAHEKHGLLTIRLPKLDRSRQAKLKVKSN